MIPRDFVGLEHLTTAVLLLDDKLQVQYLNPAAENLFALSVNHVIGLSLQAIFPDNSALNHAMQKALSDNSSYTEHEITLATPAHPNLAVSGTFTQIDVGQTKLLIEFHEMDNQIRVAREERMRMQQQANQELLRNLAHEIKNPLGGLRGAAQLLERELPKTQLREYTQVIIKEADRLQALLDKLLTPHRLPQFEMHNVHESLERVRSLIAAEYPNIILRRDYDTSLPELWADPKQLIQAFLNIARNAVQAMKGQGQITLKTRIARQVTLAKKRYRHAIHLQIIDNGPGIDAAIREKMFYPLVSGREHGTGLGLTFAQTFVSQHQGSIECESRPGYTCFTLFLPILE